MKLFPSVLGVALIVASGVGCGTTGGTLPGASEAVVAACQTSWGLTNEQLQDMINLIEADKGQGILADNMRQSLDNQCDARDQGDADKAACKECSVAVVNQVYGL